MEEICATARQGRHVSEARRVLPRLLHRTKTRSSGARRNAFFVGVSVARFRLWWLLALLVHALCIGYFTVFSYIYWVLPGSYTGVTLELYMLTMPLRYFPLVSVSHGLIAAGHTFFMLRMLLSTLVNRRFTFGKPSFHMPKPEGGKQHTKISRRIRVNLARATTVFSAIWTKIFSRRGVFGIESKHFDVLFVMRELLEASLQSIQAYRMSLYVPRVLLNRFYVAVIVVNCCSSPLAVFMYPEDPPRARLLRLVLDITLDFVSSVGIPGVLLRPYRGMFSFADETFDFLLWYDDFWLVNTINEFKLLFASSWGDFVARMFFSVSLLVSLQNAKSLLRKTAPRISPDLASPNRRTTSSFLNESEPPPLCQSSRWLSIPPAIVQFAKSVSRRRSGAFASVRRGRGSASSSPVTSKSTIPMSPARAPTISRKIARASHFVFPIWGLCVLALHLRGEFQNSPPECVLSVRPWFSSKLACSLLKIDCRKLGLSCSMDEMDAILKDVDEGTLTHIVIRHCSAVEMSPRLQQFPHLVGLKIYNSTLVRWDGDAALTGAHHPHMVFLFLVSVNMSSFPEGLLSDNFPRQLLDVEFAGTNLTSLPSNLYTKWPVIENTCTVFEQGILESVPAVIEQMKPSFFSLVGNHISEIPEFVFTNDAAITVWLSGNPIEKLPENLAPSPSIHAIRLANTRVQTLPAWMNDHFFEHAVIVGGGSPFCEDLLVASESGGSQSETSRNISSAVLAAFANDQIDCEPVSGDFLTYYPSDVEAGFDFRHP